MKKQLPDGKEPVRLSDDPLLKLHANRQSEETMSLIMDYALDAIVCMDAHGIVTFWNRQAENIFGWKEEEVSGKRMSDYIIPEAYRSRHEEGLKMYIRNRDASILNKLLEISALKRDGKEFPIELTIIPIQQEGSEFFCAFIRDISERKKAEVKRIQNEERFRAIFDNEPECVKVVDISGNLLEMNPAGLEMMEAGKDAQLVGTKVIEFVHPEDRGIYMALHEKVCRGESGSADFRMIGLKHTQRWMESNSVPLRNVKGEIYAVLSVARDITEIKKSQELLINNEKRYQALVENGSDLVVILTAEGKPKYISPSVERILGYSKEEILEINMFSLLHPDDIGDAVEVMTNAMKNPGIPIAGLPGRVLHKNGTWRWCESTITNMLGYPYIEGIVNNFRDITERVRNEFEMKQLLNMTSQQNKRLQNFSYIVSHNIRSHSVNISGLVDVILEEQDESEKASLLKMLESSTGKLSETIENLNEIITIQNETNLSMSDVNLRTEVDKTRYVVNSFISQTHTTFINLVPEDMVVKVIPAYLESIILNLVTNAVKYRSPHRPPVIKISAERTAEYVVLSIEDNGIGINLEKNGKKLFGMYKTFHDNNDSSGFGLYITKNQVEAMNGKIEVESTVDAGSVFRIYFKIN